MKRVVAYCGIVCSDCPTFKATKANDDAERRRVAELWIEQYGREFKADDINCDGCLTDGARVFGHCETCKMRTCARERKVENCAHCEDYACEKLATLFRGYKPAKEVLDEIRASLRI